MMTSSVEFVIASPKDSEMRAAGFKETHGFGLWTNPNYPLTLIDTNADAVAVFVYPNLRDVGTIVDEVGFYKTRDILTINGLPCLAL